MIYFESARPSSTAPDPNGSAAKPLRLRHVDSLRAVAAGLVVWTHLAGEFLPVSTQNPRWLDFLHTWPRNFNLGRVGVIIFFAISGFVICRSFGGPRQGGMRRFALKRFFRLYPAFWLSMVAGSLVWWVSAQPFTWSLLAANATMAPGPFGEPPIVGLYWTLEFELAFYGACMGLYLFGWIGRRGVLSGLIILLLSLPRALRLFDHAAGTHLAVGDEAKVWLVSLAVMFFGAVVRLVYEETGGFRPGSYRQMGPWLVALLTLAIIDVPDPNVKLVLLHLRSAPMPNHAQTIMAVLIFLLWIVYLRVDHPVLTYLGVISYSLYLFHPTVMFFLTHLLRSASANGWFGSLPLWVLLLTGAALSTALAAGVYRWVERPAISLGRRCSR